MREIWLQSDYLYFITEQKTKKWSNLFDFKQKKSKLCLDSHQPQVHATPKEMKTCNNLKWQQQRFYALYRLVQRGQHECYRIESSCFYFFTFLIMTDMQLLKCKMDEIQASDNLTPREIMIMDMCEYHRLLVDRARMALWFIPSL